MKKRNKLIIGLASAFVGLLSLGLFACSNVAVMAKAEDSSSSSSPMEFEYPIDYYPSADFSDMVATESNRWRYVGDLDHNKLGGESSGLITPNAMSIYVLNHLSITYDGYGEYNGATWQQLAYTGADYINYSDLTYPFLTRGQSACWFAVYWGNSSKSFVVYDFFNACPAPKWDGVTSSVTAYSVPDNTSPYGVSFTRQIYMTNSPNSVGFYLTDDNEDDPQKFRWTHFLNNVAWTYAQAYVRDGRPAGWAYQQGYTAGKNDGKSEGYNTGYNAGYNAGKSAVTDEGLAVTNLFGAIASVPISVLNGLSGFVVWNVPLISLCVTFLFIGIVLWIVKKFI